jgi:murein DD-endopeptidase MepM/ murein hydrolase activator NlpD
MGHAVRRQAAGVFGGIGPDRIVALTVAGILLLASVISVSAGSLGKAPRPIGGTIGSGTAPRLSVGGAAGLDRDEWFIDTPLGSGDVEGAPGLIAAGPIDAGNGGPTAADAEQPVVEEPVVGPYLEDGTLLKPVFVDTTVEDGADLLRTYKVKAGDTLTGIARKFHVSMMTLWWANKLDSKDELHQGQVLTIPPVSGLVVTVTANDTLQTLATKYKVKAKEILEANDLQDPNLVVGQVLVMPGAKGKPIPTPKPKPRAVSQPRNGGGGGGGGNGGGGSEGHYTGGHFLYPVVGGGNYISQYFHYGHYAIDIAADYGTRVRAAAGGRVVFAGWKSNGGGYQVWISHGSGLYTTYNHMSAVTVGNGQGVDRGQQVGRVGQSGNATGPHLHFEVWRGGEPWNGGTRVNPLGYL